MNKKAEIVSFMIVCLMVDGLGILITYASTFCYDCDYTFGEAIKILIPAMIVLNLIFGICTVNDCGDK